MSEKQRRYRGVVLSLDELACAVLLDVYQFPWEHGFQLGRYTFSFSLPQKNSTILIDFSEGSLAKEKKTFFSREKRTEKLRRLVLVQPTEISIERPTQENRIREVFASIKSVFGASRISSQKVEASKKLFRSAKAVTLKKEIPQEQPPPRKWSQDALQLLRNNYGKRRSDQEIAAWLKINVAEVRKKAAQIDLKHSKAGRKRAEEEKKERKRYDYYTTQIGPLTRLQSGDWLTTDEFSQTLGLPKQKLFRWEKRKQFPLFRANGYTEPFPGYRIVMYSPERAAKILTKYEISVTAHRDGKPLGEVATSLGIAPQAIRERFNRIESLGYIVGNSWGDKPGETAPYIKPLSLMLLEELFEVDQWELQPGQLPAAKAAKILGRSKAFVERELKPDGFYYDQRRQEPAPFFLRKRMIRLKQELSK